MRVRNDIDVHNVISSINQTGHVSDKLVGIGPVGIGLDGILTWIPGVGEIYTLGASAFLLTQARKARVSGIVLWQMAALLLFDLSLEAIPIAGSMVDTLFCAHLWSAMLLRRAITNAVYVTADEAEARDPKITAAMHSGKHIIILPQA